MANKSIKIQIKSWLNGSVLFEYESEDNTIKKTLEEAVKGGADLGDAYLRGANLRDADLGGANLRGAYLRDANLRGAYLRDANLRGAYLRDADLRGAYLGGANLGGADLGDAYLRGANLGDAYLRDANLGGADLLGIDLHTCKLENLPEQFINLCSRDMLFIFEHLKAELPGLRKALVEGRVNGSQYEGECACLIGTLANVDGGIEKVCNAIPFYEKSADNPAETWFLAIHEGDKPEDNEFSAHAVKLIDMVLGEPKTKKVAKK